MLALARTIRSLSRPHKGRTIATGGKPWELPGLLRGLHRKIAMAMLMALSTIAAMQKAAAPSGKLMNLSPTCCTALSTWFVEAL
jgi:hypothetical protein